MTEEKRKKAKEITDNVLNWAADAAWDIADSFLHAGTMGDRKWEAKIRKGKRFLREQKKMGYFFDLKGWLADEVYSDADCMQDFLGDRIWDETHGDDELRSMVLDELQTRGDIWTKIAKNLRR